MTQTCRVGPDRLEMLRYSRARCRMRMLRKMTSAASTSTARISILFDPCPARSRRLSPAGARAPAASEGATLVQFSNASCKGPRRERQRTAVCPVIPQPVGHPGVHFGDRAVPVVQVVRGRHVEAVIMTPTEAKRLRSPLLAEGHNELAALFDSILAAETSDAARRSGASE